MRLSAAWATYPGNGGILVAGLEMPHLGADEMACQNWQQRQYVRIADKSHFRNLPVMIANEFEMRDETIEIFPARKFFRAN